MKKHFALLVLFGAVFGLMISAAGNKEDSDSASTSVYYTMEEVAKHAEAGDCWMVIDGKVYDVTEFIAQKRHPGGAAILEGCGKDATELFMTRPMGSKTAHSNRAMKALEKYKIGYLKKEE